MLAKLEWLVKSIVIENIGVSSKKPLVSVVIPYYNRAATIDETLESLRSQTFINFEVIIVNDGSTEQESIDKLEKLAYPDINLRIIQQQNAGVAAARNTGIAQAKAPYILCLDSDDMLAPTYIEKCLISLETDANIDLVATDMHFFGVQDFVYKQGEYNPAELTSNNMVETAALYRKQAWVRSGGYKNDIGYEDWEYWVTLAENGFWGKIIPEPLFNYRTAVSSRYIDDKSKHKLNLRSIKELHPHYMSRIRKMTRTKYFRPLRFRDDTKYVNLSQAKNYAFPSPKKGNILIVLPWMTFGGAETLVLNFCEEVKDNFNISFVTGLKSENEWEHKFQNISQNIYHLGNLFAHKEEYVGFISNYIITRNIDTLHIVHNDFLFELLPAIAAKHPELKVIVTLFNDRAGYIEQLDAIREHIDTLSTDNRQVADIYRKQGWSDAAIRLIPNGIDCYKKFNQTLFDRSAERAALAIAENQKAVFFIGRLSEEKNPDVFVEAAVEIIEKQSNDNLVFFIIGDGPMRQQLEKQIKRCNSSRLTYLGYQDNIARYLSAADIFVLPSAVEGFPLSILEAMAMRVAVIASDVGAVSDVITSGRSGFIVEPGSVQEIVDVVMKLGAEHELLETVKDNARFEVEKLYSNIVLGKNYRALYERGQR